MTKKRLSDNVRKSAIVLVRLSPDELRVLSDAANLNKLKIATYARRNILKGAELDLSRRHY